MNETVTPTTRIAPGEAVAMLLQPGDVMRICDPIGKQVADLVAFNAGDSLEWLSSGRTIDYTGTISPTIGHTLFSNRSHPMLTIVADTVGRHDFMFAACSREMYEIQYGDRNHPNCLEALSESLARYGIGVDQIATPLNVFMNVSIDSEKSSYEIHDPLSIEGSHVEFRVEMKIIAAVSACPSRGTNAGNPGPIDVSAWRPG